MDDLVAHTQGLLKVSSVFIALCLLAALLFPAHRDIVYGILLGSGVSIVNAIYLSIKVRRVTDMALSGQPKRVGFGFATRAALAILAVFAANKLDQVNVVATVASLLFAQFVIFGIGAYRAHKQG